MFVFQLLYYLFCYVLVLEDEVNDLRLCLQSADKELAELRDEVLKEKKAGSKRSSELFQQVSKLHMYLCVCVCVCVLYIYCFYRLLIWSRKFPPKKLSMKTLYRNFRPFRCQNQLYTLYTLGQLCIMYLWTTNIGHLTSHPGIYLQELRIHRLFVLLTLNVHTFFRTCLEHARTCLWSICLFIMCHSLCCVTAGWAGHSERGGSLQAALLGGEGEPAWGDKEDSCQSWGGPRGTV